MKKVLIIISMMIKIFKYIEILKDYIEDYISIILYVNESKNVISLL